MTITLDDLARALNGTLWGDGSIRITGAGEPADVAATADGSARVALAMSPKYAENLASGSVALLAEGMDPAAYRLAGAVLVLLLT